MASHYLNQWWWVYWHIYVSFCLNELSGWIIHIKELNWYYCVEDVPVPTKINQFRPHDHADDYKGTSFYMNTSLFHRHSFEIQFHWSDNIIWNGRQILGDIVALWGWNKTRRFCKIYITYYKLVTNNKCYGYNLKTCKTMINTQCFHKPYFLSPDLTPMIFNFLYQYMLSHSNVG